MKRLSHHLFIAILMFIVGIAVTFSYSQLRVSSEWSGKVTHDGFVWVRNYESYSGRKVSLSMYTYPTERDAHEGLKDYLRTESPRLLETEPINNESGIQVGGRARFLRQAGRHGAQLTDVLLIKGQEIYKFSGSSLTDVLELEKSVKF